MSSDDEIIIEACNNHYLINIGSELIIKLSNSLKCKMNSGSLNTNDSLQLLRLLDFHKIQTNKINKKIAKLIDSHDFNSILVIELLNSKNLLELLLPYMYKTLDRYINCIHIFNHNKICDLYYLKPDLFENIINHDVKSEINIYKFRYDNIFIVEMKNVIEEPVQSLCLAIKLNKLNVVQYFYNIWQRQNCEDYRNNKKTYHRTFMKTDPQLFPIMSLKHDDPILTKFLIDQLKEPPTQEYFRHLMILCICNKYFQIIELLHNEYQIEIFQYQMKFDENKLFDSNDKDLNKMDNLLYL